MNMKISQKFALVLALLLLFAALTGCGPSTSESQNPTQDGVIGAPDLSASPVPGDPSPTFDSSQFEDPDGIPDEGDEGLGEKMNYEEHYEEAKAKNSDVVGWISVPNTVIEYPVVQTTDNEYYLYHNVDREESKSGAIYMDYRNTDFENDKHIIIYGHNMRNGTMFHELNNYKMQDFFDQNSIITLYYQGEMYQYQVFSAQVVLADVNFIRTSFKSDEEFVQYFTEFQDESKFTTNVEIEPGDQILTLSTCTYEYDDSRFIVQAKRI